MERTFTNSEVRAFCAQEIMGGIAFTPKGGVVDKSISTQASIKVNRCNELRYDEGKCKCALKALSEGDLPRNLVFSEDKPISTHLLTSGKFPNISPTNRY